MSVAFLITALGACVLPKAFSEEGLGFPRDVVGEVEVCQEEEGDCSLSLRQLRGEKILTAGQGFERTHGDQQSFRVRRGLALQGGGLLAVASQAAITAALLHVRGGSSTLAGSGLLERIDALSGVSGGSWFAASLIYSAGQFVPMVEQMAHSPEQAGKIFGANWTTQWMSAARLKNTWGSFMQATSKFFGLTWYWKTLEEFAVFWDRGKRWKFVVAALLGHTAGIGDKLPLGASVAEWATGKAFLVDHSLVVGKSDAEVIMWRDVGGSVNYHISSRGNKTLPVYVPAKFSVRLGAGAGSAAPFPYIARSAAEHFNMIKYYHSSVWPWSRAYAETSISGDTFAGFEGHADKLTIVEATSASSAAIGGMCVCSWCTKMNEAFQVQFTPWVSLKGATEIFEQAWPLVNGLRRRSGRDQKSMDAVAHAHIAGVIDGGYTDNTGIAHLVAEGADEVLCLTHNHHDKAALGVVNLFHDTPSVIYEAGVPDLRFPIFAESASHAEAEIANFSRLEAPGNLQHLQEITIGTLHATTLHNEWFGVSAGRKVTLRVLNLHSSMGIGFFAELPHYNILVQEIVSSLTSPANAEKLREHLSTTVL